MDIDIENEEFDAAPYGMLMDMTRSYYAMYSVWSPIHNKENIAVLAITPSHNYTGGALIVFSYFGATGQGYIAESKKLIRKFNHLRHMLIQKYPDGKLIWEGKINGLTRQTICQYESPWLN